ncbi:MAG: nuclear transport factor 2 family protein [Candidatus Sulfotelmatobacter sp.]
MLGVILVTGGQRQNERPMNRPTLHSKTISLACGAILLPLCLLPLPSLAQTAQKKPASLTSIQQELVRTETGFFEAWKMKDQAYFREHIAENGVFWNDSGTFSRDQQLQDQEAAAKACKVDGYGLSDFGVLPLTDGAYLLIYKAEQYAVCDGEKVPVHLNGSSVYILKAGHWQAIYRAQVPLKNQS